jgi:hypothetical protein
MWLGVVRHLDAFCVFVVACFRLLCSELGRGGVSVKMEKWAVAAVLQYRIEEFRGSIHSQQIRRVWQAVAAGAIDFAVFCCVSACRVWLRVSQLRQVQSILRFRCCLVWLRVS